ncbi:RNA-guided endonuclease InsQ/TnpB family protein [Serpentinicella alkaliphila]|uniref:Putative transposase n=1 Tax=Serpentinicella alkaliphila TaxID=1734049 RepID=A0A4R2TDC0_9FIRM|nr:RNA-guided endonuclease TnpB family protein [Serpentinicella alkaliphila]TCQ00516.1 putative transposase [Serpentinicella alkaliphila]
MLYNEKIEVFFSKEDSLILDGQSKICNWLYNQLLQATKDDYENGNSLKLLSGRNLRNYSTKMKDVNKFLYSVHSSPLKNTALRLKDAYERFFKGQNEYPKFRSWKKYWFSLYYDEPNKGFKVDGQSLKISLGKAVVFDKKGKEKGKQVSVTGELKESLVLPKGAKIKTFRLCKQQGDRFYAIFTIEAIEPNKKEEKSWIAIDQNHKNFFVAIDNTGRTFEFLKLYQTKYWDEKIDLLKSKRDLCLKKAKEHTTIHGNKYYTSSKRYHRINKALNKAYNTRREQIKSIMYQIAHFIAKNYDHVIIGNYVPSKNTAKYKTMHRSMLNQAHIGEFRKILEWVMLKSGKHFSLVDEKDTTKICSMCGHKEKKPPNIREFTCSNCDTFMLRDVNSAVNMANKVSLTPMSFDNIDKINKVGVFNFKRYSLMVV